MLSLTPDDKPQGWDREGNKWHCALVMNDDGNTICGKANPDTGKCWVPYGGMRDKENFMYILGEPDEEFKDPCPQGY